MTHNAFMGDLGEAERPVILVGGGAYKAREAIRQFAEKHRIPVVCTWNAQDVVTADSPCFAGIVGTYGGPGRNFAIQNADLLLVIGCRVSGRITGGQPQTFARAAKRYWVDVDADLLDEHEWRPSTAICDEAGTFVDRCMSGQYVSWSLGFSRWLERCIGWRDKYDPVLPEMLAEWHHYGVMRRLSEELPDDAIVVYDTGGNAIMMGHCFRSKRGQRIFSSNGNTPMGFSMCGAIGAWFAEPQRTIICIIGDGGMQLNIQELQTIRHYNAKVKVFIFNNGILGNTKAYQRVNGKPEICCGPDGYSAPVFSAVVNAYGIKSFTLGEWERFEYVVQGALAHDGPCVVDIIDEDRCTYEPRISKWDTPIEDAYPYLPREEFRDNMLVEPMDGWEKVK